jgi:hypothetical protein
MKNKELREKIIAYNKSVKEKTEKASDFDILLGGIMKLAPGQVKKFLADGDVQAVLRKHGVEI